MPKYGVHKYGTFKYGKYILSSGGGGGGNFKLGPHVRYRIRTISPDGKPSDFITMVEDRVSVKGYYEKARIRTNNGEWIYTQTETVSDDAVKVRIRSIDSGGGLSEWVYGVRGNLKQQ